MTGLGATRVVMTGRSAVGKSVLSSRMRGLTEDLAWELPVTSEDVESGVITIGEWAQIIRVIPGQGIRERDKGLHEAFYKHDKLRGVIHVVDWGFTCPRDSVVRRQWIREKKRDTIEKLRQHNLEVECRDFEKVCERIRESYAVFKRPKWLMIAVTKADLFMDDLNEAQAYYHPKVESPFTRILKEQLLDKVGDQHITCRAMPVSAWDMNFEWNGEVVPSNIGGTNEARALFRNFLQALAVLEA